MSPSDHDLGLVAAESSAGIFLARSLKRAEYSECQEASASIARPTGSQPGSQVLYQDCYQAAACQCASQGIRCGTHAIDRDLQASRPVGLQGSYPREQSFTYQEPPEPFREESRIGLVVTRPVLSGRLEPANSDLAS